METINDKKMFSLGIGVTSKCNMKCEFCYSQKKRQDIKDLPLDDWKRFILKFGQSISAINYGTGENALSEQWFELVEYTNVTYPMIQQAVTTNGTLVHEIKANAKFKSIIDMAISEIDVSIDFSDPEKHNKSRGHRGAFQAAINTLQYCVDTGKSSTIVILGINDTLSKENLIGLFQIAQKYKSLIRVNLYRPVVKTAQLTPPSLDTVLDALDFISSQYRILSLNDPLFSSVLAKDHTIDDPSFIKSMRIASDGNIYPSTYLISDNYVLANINEISSLNDLKSSPFAKSFEGMLPKECHSCTCVDSCRGGTIDRRMLTYGTLEARDPYCPKRFNMAVPTRQYKVDRGNFSSVHEGYLSTLFFAP